MARRSDTSRGAFPVILAVVQVSAYHNMTGVLAQSDDMLDDCLEL